MKILFIILFLLACSENNEVILSPEQKQIENVQISTEPGPFTFNINVFYEVGAEPYAGTVNLGKNNTWDITKASMISLFQHIDGRKVTVPYELSEMKQISPQSKSTWTTNELVEVAEKIKTPMLQEFEIQTYVIYLKGTFNGNPEIIGLHLTGENYVFIFKDVIESVGGSPLQQKYVEQSTVVHELGHLVGLVNNGIKPVSNHEDQANPHHTIHKDCVMYHAVEKPGRILSILAAIIGRQELNLFGDEVISDISNH